MMHPTLTIHMTDNLGTEHATVDIPMPVAPIMGSTYLDAEEFERLLDIACRRFRQVFEDAAQD